MIQVNARLAGLSLLVTLSACATEYPSLTARASGFQHPTYGYGFAYRGGERGLLAPGWEPHLRAGETREVPVDEDSDGVVDGALPVPVFDLLYARGSAGGAVFVSTFPTSREAAASDLGGLLASYVTSAARAGQITYGFPRAVSRSGPPMASRVLGSRPREVAGRAAHELLFEIANVPAEHVTDTTVWSRGHVVLVRPELTFSDQQYSRTRGSSTAAFFPVLMVLGYANTAGDFAAHHGDFEDLVSRLHFTEDTTLQRLSAALRDCVERETLVELLVLPEGRVGAHAALEDETSERCVSQTLVRATLPRADWPRTYALRITPEAAPANPQAR